MRFKINTLTQNEMHSAKPNHQIFCIDVEGKVRHYLQHKLHFEGYRHSLNQPVPVLGALTFFTSTGGIPMIKRLI